MDVYKDGNCLECNYTNGYKYKVERGRIYRKDWETGEVMSIMLDEWQSAKVDEYEVRDPCQNGPTWFFLHNLWKDARKIAEGYDEKPIKYTEEDDF